MGEIYKPVVIFIATSVISFAGSLQLGPVNLMVIQSVLRRNLRAGLWVAVGGALPELIYAVAAIWAGIWLSAHQDIWMILEWSAIPVFFFMGVIIFFTPNRPIKLEKVKQPSFSFVKGFTFGVLNPQLFPYWLVILIQYGSYDLLRVQKLSEQIAFVAGTAVGALGLLVGVAYLTFHFRETLLEKLEKLNINRLLGILFVALSLGQFLKLWLKT